MQTFVLSSLHLSLVEHSLRRQARRTSVLLGKVFFIDIAVFHLTATGDRSRHPRVIDSATELSYQLGSEPRGRKNVR